MRALLLVGLLAVWVRLPPGRWTMATVCTRSNCRSSRAGCGSATTLAALACDAGPSAFERRERAWRLLLRRSLRHPGRRQFGIPRDHRCPRRFEARHLGRPRAGDAGDRPGQRRTPELQPSVGAAGGDLGNDSAVPYVGFGYSSTSLKGGWGFSADLGVMALNPGNAMRLGRAFGSVQSAEDLIRDLRLSPAVQVGASYSF